MPYKNPEDKKAKDKAYYKANSEKAKAYDKSWRENNRDKMKVYSKAYHEANKERHAATNKAYREVNKEKKKAYNEVYYEANKGKFIAWVRAYKATKKQNNCITTKEDKQMAKWIYTTASKLTETTDIKWEVDHIKPLSKGGMHSLDNLQIVPMQWNRKKRNNNEERWNG